MILNDLIKKYNFHDSLVTNINYDSNRRLLDIAIDFCYWAQPNYDKTSPETGLIHLCFNNVKEFQSSGLSGDIDDYSILDTTIENNILILNVFDDFKDVPYTLKIDADTVNIK